MKMKSLLLLLSSLCILNGVFAKEIPARPQSMVNDYAGALSPAQVSALEQKLRAYEKSTSTQIAIVIDRSLEDDDAFEYSFRLAKAWGIGQKDKDNGVLIYVAQAERKIRIVTNTGVQGFLTDALSKRIIETTIKPAFQKGDYYAGLDGAVNDIIKVAAGEYKNDTKKGKDAGGGVLSFVILLAIIIGVIVMFSLLSRRSNNGGRGLYGGGRYDDRGYGPGGGWFIFPGGGFGGGGSNQNSDWGGSGGGGDDWGGFGGSDGFDGGGAGGDW